jgi:hypothetical protein
VGRSQVYSDEPIELAPVVGALLVAAELVHGHAGRGGELLKLGLHRLAELAPRRVDDHGARALGLDRGRLLGRLQLDHLRRRRPEVAVKGALGALDVDAALRLRRAILCTLADIIHFISIFAHQ